MKYSKKKLIKLQIYERLLGTGGSHPSMDYSPLLGLWFSELTKLHYYIWNKIQKLSAIFYLPSSSFLWLLLSFVNYKLCIINGPWQSRTRLLRRKCGKKRNQNSHYFMHGWPFRRVALCAQQSKLECFPDMG